MAVIKVKHRKRYTAISNDVLEDRRLAWDTLGLLCFLLSKPDHWECKPKQLIGYRSAGRDRVRRMLRDLQDCGYLVRQKIRDSGGRYAWVSIVSEAPTIDGLPVGGSPVDGLPGDIVKTEEANTDLVKVKPQQPLKNGRRFELDPAAAAAWDETSGILRDQGISLPMIIRLLGLGWMSTDYAKKHCEAADREKITTGLLIRRMLDGDPAPKIRDRTVIPAEYADIVKR